MSGPYHSPPERRGRAPTVSHYGHAHGHQRGHLRRLPGRRGLTSHLVGYSGAHMTGEETRPTVPPRLYAATASQPMFCRPYALCAVAPARPCVGQQAVALCELSLSYPASACVWHRHNGPHRRCRHRTPHQSCWDCRAVLRSSSCAATLGMASASAGALSVGLDGGHPASMRAVRRRRCGHA